MPCGAAHYLAVAAHYLAVGVHYLAVGVHYLAVGVHYLADDAGPGVPSGTSGPASAA